MVKTNSKKMMMAGAAAVAAIAVVALSVSGTRKSIQTNATNTYSVSFSSSNRPFSGSVSSSDYKTNVSAYSSYTISGHNPIRSAVIQGDTGKYGSIYYPTGSLVAATVATTSQTVNNATVYESVVRFVIGANNITAFAAEVARSNIYTYNSFYVIFYDSNFKSLGYKSGTESATLSGGFYYDTANVSFDTKQGVARWVELQYCLTSTAAGKTGTSGAYVTNASLSWSC